MRKKILLFLICGIILSVGIAIFVGCGEQSSVEKPSDLMQDITAQEIQTDVDLKGPGAVAITDFGVRLLQNIEAEEMNVLLSPLSIAYALGMTENGAEGETLKQMENVLGMPCEELRDYLCTFVRALPESDKYKLGSANSIWLKKDENFTINREFLQANADWYKADIYEEVFDSSSLERINNWVKEKTEDRIEEILSEIPEDAVMYLINALVFDAQWETVYNEYQVQEDIFVKEDGTKQTANFMHSEESRYLEDEHACGFLKYYADEKYAFAALLPDDNISVEDYVASLTGEKLHTILTDATDITVYASLPKFTSEYSVNLKMVLQTLGIRDAFDPALADFSRMGSYTNSNIFIDRVIHKTFIAVDEQGTEAGAATLVEMMKESAALDAKTVLLNRPFVYLLIDCETNVPIFMGVTKTIEE